MKEINLHTLICLYEVIIKKFFDELVNIDYKELQQMLFEKEMKETAVYGCSLDHSKDNKIYVQDMINMTDNERRDHSREIANTYLNILKKIVENHNGIITASSQLNQGAIFDIYIPAS